MDLKSGFFNSINGDRVYTADDMMYPYKGIVSNGVIASDTYSEGLQVKAKEALQVTVKAGFGIFNSKWAELEQDTTFNLATPHVTLSRIDSFVVRVDLTTEGRKVSLEYLQSEPAENPVPPTLNNTDALRDYRLCNILVAPNATEITQAEITDTRPTSECGFVSNLLQNSDISATYEQWHEQFRQWLAEKETEHESFVTNYESFMNEHEQAITQAETEYNEWTQEKQQAYDEWFNSLTDELLVKEAFFSYSSVYTATTDGETNIPINISAFSSSTDILTVYINGLKLIANVDYTLNGYQSITLTKGIDAGTVVAFDLLKTVVTTDVETVSNELQRIIKLIPAEATETNKLADKAYVDSVAGGGGGGGGAELEEIKKLIPAEATETNKLADKAYVNTSIDNLEDAILVANPAYTEMLWEQIQEGATETPISTPERIEEIWEAIGESGNSGDVSLNLSTHSVNYTYVVDSNQKLLDWANNVTGNDYTSVLIRKGTWTSSKVVNLTNAGTKVVVGEAGSKLIFDGNVNGLYYSVAPTTSDYYMNGVNVEGVSVGSCFENCINLTNCNAVCTTVGTAFELCSNLTNCTGVSIGTVNGYAFYKCNNLTNCHGTGTARTNGAGFQLCNNLTNCTGVGISEYSSCGFRHCVSLTNCAGTGTLNSTSGTAYGYIGCTLVSKSKAGANCANGVFSASYASSAKTSDYACADTPAGGFNDTTNPSE